MNKLWTKNNRSNSTAAHFRNLPSKKRRNKKRCSLKTNSQHPESRKKKKKKMSFIPWNTTHSMIGNPSTAGTWPPTINPSGLTILEAISINPKHILKHKKSVKTLGLILNSKKGALRMTLIGIWKIGLSGPRNPILRIVFLSIWSDSKLTQLLVVCLGFCPLKNDFAFILLD